METVTASDILSLYCAAACAISDHEPIRSIPYIARHFGISEYMARKHIHRLVAEGLLVKDHEGGLSDWDWQVYCYHGYRITKKARATKEYKQAAYREAKYDAEWLGGHMNEYWRTLTKA